MRGVVGKAVSGIVAAILGSACATQSVQQVGTEPGVSAREERMEELERRLRRMERGARPAASTYPAAPLQTPAERERLRREQLETLRQRQRALLEKYTSRHPEVLFLEREIHRQESSQPIYESPLREIPSQ